MGNQSFFFFVVKGATRGEQEEKEVKETERKVRMKKPKGISNEQAKRLEYWIDGRFKVIFELAVESGMRISDILALRVRDIQNPMTVYETKSKRKRTFTLSDNLYQTLLFFKDWQSDNAYVFYSEQDSTKHVHRSTVHRQIKKALTWLDFDASAHSARKLYAQNIYEKTGSVEKVQKALNHRKIQTTLAYLDIPQQNEEEGGKSATEGRFKRIVNAIKKIFKR
jgi:integrase